MRVLGRAEVPAPAGVQQHRGAGQFTVEEGRCGDAAARGIREPEHLDSPYHRYAQGGDLASLDLATLVGVPAEVFRLTDAASRGIPAEVFLDRELAGTAVLLHTGWSRHFGAPEYAHGSPFLTEAGARHLVDAGVAIVGIDALNIDDTESGGERPAHSILLAAGVHVVEHLTALDRVPVRGARFTAVPPRVEGFGTFPVRAFAELPAR